MLVLKSKYEKLKEKYEKLKEMRELCKAQRDQAELRVIEVLAERDESEKVMFSVSVSLGEAHKTLKKLKYGCHHESMQE